MQDLQKMQTEPPLQEEILGADAVVQAEFGGSLGFSDDKMYLEENGDLMGQSSKQLQEDVQIGSKVFQRHNRETSRHGHSSAASNGAGQDKTPLFNVLHSFFENENRIQKDEAYNSESNTNSVTVQNSKTKAKISSAVISTQEQQIKPQAQLITGSPKKYKSLVP